jgi:glycosyltransferase involved in cell wall biosynthesis
MQRKIAELEAQHAFDARICDFLFPSVNIPDLRNWTLFQHNVETVIWERHAREGRTALHRAYFSLQAKKMAAWEQRVCRAVANVVAVSEQDAAAIASRFGLKKVEAVPTGVDTEYFARRGDTTRTYDFVFVGSMDWMPNLDGMKWFFADVLPLMRRARPDLKIAVVGRKPPASFVSEAQALGVEVTGTVPDVRPYLWGSAVSIVPLRIGGGTRLKIFEAMAAGVPVVSTSIGAEGLPAEDGRTICMADTADEFAARCLELLDNDGLRERISRAGREMVVNGFSWEQVTTRFEQAIRVGAAPSLAVP